MTRILQTSVPALLNRRRFLMMGAGSAVFPHSSLAYLGTADPAAEVLHGWAPRQTLGTSGDYVVAPDGSDANPGTLTRPFATINRAIAAARAAGNQRTIRVRAGVYREEIDTAGWDGLPGAPNRLAGYGREKPVITGADPLTGWSQCDETDAGVLGPRLGTSASPVWKTRISAPALRPLYRCHVIEAGRVLPIATDMAASAHTPMAYNDTARLREAQSFETDAAGKIMAITDAPVIGAYSGAQLQRMWVSYYRYPNWTTIAPVTGAKGATLLIDPTHGPQGTSTRYGLMNALPNLQAGSWGLVDHDDGTVTVYVYPGDEANLAAGMEIMVRDKAASLTASDHLIFEGFELRHAAGPGLVCGRPGVNAEHKQQGLTLQQLCIREVFGNGLSARYADDLTIAHVSVADPYGAYGLSVTDATGGHGARLKILHCDILRAEQSPIQLYAQHEALVAYCRLRDSGFGAHANLFNNYVGSDRVMWWGLKVENCRGYATWQQSTRTVIGMSCFDNAVMGGDAIRDQNGGGAGTEPVHPSDNWVINNTLGNREIAVGSNAPQGDHIHHVHNNIAKWVDAAEGPGATTQFVGGFNIWTEAGGSSAFENAFDAVIAPGAVFTDPATFDYSLAPGSPAIGWGGKDLDAKLREWEALYGVDLHRDVDGVPFERLAFVGARAAAHQADVTTPVLRAPMAGAASSAALDVGVTTDTAVGGIWWVVTRSATAPTPAQVAAGRDHAGQEAEAAGIVAASAAGTALSARAGGLAAESRYHVHFTHETRHGRRSTVVSAAAETAAAPTGVRLIAAPVLSYSGYAREQRIAFGAAEPGDMRIAITARGDRDTVTTDPTPDGWIVPGSQYDGTAWTKPANSRVLIFARPVTETEPEAGLQLSGSLGHWATIGLTLRGPEALAVGGYTNTSGSRFTEQRGGGLLTVYHAFRSDLSDDEMTAAANGLPLNPTPPAAVGHFVDDMRGIYSGNRNVIAFTLTPHDGGVTMLPLALHRAWPRSSCAVAFVHAS
jgi:hypothetical protein